MHKIMYLYLLVALTCGGLSVSAQSSQGSLSPALSEIAYPTGTAGWITFKPGQNLNPLTIFETHREAFGLGESDEMHITETRYDKQGFVHYQYQLYRAGIEVEHAVYYIHAMQGRSVRANGFMPRIGEVDTQVVIEEEAAIEAAKNHLGASVYMWEEPGYEAIIQAAKNNPEASFYPTPERLLVDTDFKWESPLYRLAYKLEVFTAQPHGCHWVYVDAQTGEILKSLNVTQPTDVEGTAVTRYSGTQPMMTDSFENGYRLREYSRAAMGIETYDLNRTENLTAAVDFVDQDNFWDNTVAADDAANDVHWGSQAVYDYFWEKYGRDSYDGQGGKILSYVHYGNNYNNAFWNVFYAGYGDGPGNNSPNTPIDIVGHEITHGIIRNSAGNLIYIDESGSLNEGHADIFGNVVEHFVNPNDLNWLVGEDHGAIRSMANPNSFGYSTNSGSGPYPDTYKGNGWYNGDADNGGAHLNSTVVSHWFYLLSEGGTGVNDRNEAYQVTGIGIDAAAAITYRSLTSYLTPTSGYADARQGAIQAAEDLYGVCSPQATATINAWHAVGLGFPVLEDDFGVIAIEPIGPCGQSSSEAVTIHIKYYGCEPILPTFLQVAYFVQDTTITAVEVITFTDSIQGGDVFSYTFTTPVDFSDVGPLALIGRTLYLDDPYQRNDSSARYETYKTEPLTLQEAITFETATVWDSIQLTSGMQASVSLEAGMGAAGSIGIMMEGGNGSQFRFVEAFPLWGGPDPDPFAYNPEYSSKACFCVDAQGMPGLLLNFELKQNFSSRYAFNFNNSVEETGKQVNNLRVMAGPDELARYTPITRNQDTFVTHSINLSAYAGTIFPLCFEGKTVQSLGFDTQGIGDRIFIDNLWITSATQVESVNLIENLRVYPNPGAGLFQLEVSLAEPQALRWTVQDALGRPIRKQEVRQQAGQSVYKINLEDTPAGLYLLTVWAGSSSQTVRLICN